MISFENTTKQFRLKGKVHTVIDNVSLSLPSNVSIGLLGQNGAGKSTLLDLIAGTTKPDRGRILRSGSVSWPVGLAASFHKDLSGVENVRFIARIYGVDTDELVEFVALFADLGEHFHMPMRSYSSGMKSRLTFGASMGIQFDTYLVDEVTSVGDASFKRKSRSIFQERMRSAGAVVVNHSMGQLRKFCAAGMVLHRGKLQYFDDLEDAISLHEENMRAL